MEMFSVVEVDTLFETKTRENVFPMSEAAGVSRISRDTTFTGIIFGDAINFEVRRSI